jgi:hypothetical protein
MIPWSAALFETHRAKSLFLQRLLPTVGKGYLTG